MLIIAIHPGHNATVALIQDGTVIGLLSQEKIDNIKNSAAFPMPAAQALMKECGLSWTEVDEVAIAGTEVFPEYCYEYLYDLNNKIINKSSLLTTVKFLEKAVMGTPLAGVFRQMRVARKKSLINEGKIELSRKLTNSPLAGKPVTFIEHHQCHSYSAYYGLARDDAPALIFTADGSGDNVSATVSILRAGTIERLAQTPPEASLGGIYSNTTRFLGMKILEHEYKVMGLAPYCKGYERDIYENLFAPVIDLDPENPLTFRSKVDCSRFYDYLTKNAVGERFDNLAGAVQILLEERITRWIRTAIEKTGIRNVYTGGGVFMNVKLNKRIQEMPEIERVHFLPSSGDESNPIGAGYALTLRNGNTPRPMDNLYLGLSYSRDNLAEFIEQNNLRKKYAVSEHENIEARIAELLADNKVVARFSGRCEWGARSLGNRAILAHPSHMESFYTVNDLIKARDFWMPFAPSMLDTTAAEYLENYRPTKAEAPYMITAFAATEKARSELRAAMHQGDHTVRPQVVTQQGNPDFYRLLNEFKRRTGVGAVLNTSLNLHGYPLVATPEQALMTLRGSGLKYLALGPFMISKSE